MEPGDYTPPPEWRGRSFKEEREEYDRTAGRSYDRAVKAGKTLSDLLEASLHTNSKGPLRFRVDDSSSMGGWPGPIVAKLGYMDVVGKEYLGNDMEISFGAFNDAYTSVKYPLQIRPFAKGVAMRTRSKEIVFQGGGGSTMEESSELAMLYDARCVSTPKAIHSVTIYVTDEMPYSFVDIEQAERILGIRLKKRLTVEEVVSELMRVSEPYAVLKPYNAEADNADPENREVRKRWVQLLGADRVATLPVAERVVDVTFGILAKVTGRVSYFGEELTGRQTPEQVKTVLEALKTVHADPTKPSQGRCRQSVGRRSGT